MSAPEQDQHAGSAGSDSDEQDAFVPQHNGSVADGDEVYDLEGNGEHPVGFPHGQGRPIAACIDDQLT